MHGNRIAGNPEAAIDTATYGATLTDYADNACDRSDPGCTQEGGRQAVAGECAGPSRQAHPRRPVRRCPRRRRLSDSNRVNRTKVRKVS